MFSTDEFVLPKAGGETSVYTTYTDFSSIACNHET